MMRPGMLGGICSQDTARCEAAQQGQALTSVSGGQARRRTAQQKPLQAIAGGAPRDELHEQGHMPCAYEKKTLKEDFSCGMN